MVLETYGNGNAPTSDEFIEVIEYLNSKGIIVVNISQCTTGMVKMGLYEASSRLIKSWSYKSGSDLTPEAAVTKLMYLLGKNISSEEIKNKMMMSLAGEQSISQSNYNFKNKDFSNKFSYEITCQKKFLLMTL